MVAAPSGVVGDAVPGVLVVPLVPATGIVVVWVGGVVMAGAIEPLPEWSAKLSQIAGMFDGL